jgi:hypothetical protein
LGGTAFLINFSDESHPHCVGAHNDDFVVAFTKLYEPLPRADRSFAREAIVLVVTAIRNVNFPQEQFLFLFKNYDSRSSVVRCRGLKWNDSSPFLQY